MWTGTDLPRSFDPDMLRRSGADGQIWLDDLPTLASRATRRFGVEVTGAPRFGGTAVVVPVSRRSSGRSHRRARAALKLVGPLMDTADEVTALTTFDGRGCVRLLDHSTPDRAVLLEWLAGGDLAGHDPADPADVTRALQIAGRLCREMARTPAPAGVASLAGGAPGWSQLLAGQHDKAVEMGIAFDRHLIDLALTVIDELARDSTPTLTHGDLSFANILCRSAEARRAGRDLDDASAWVAIDPLLLRGTAAHEAHTVVRSLLASMPGDTSGAASALARWTSIFCVAADLDETWATRLSFARHVASYYAEAQSQGDPITIARLRTATLATHQLLS